MASRDREGAANAEPLPRGRGSPEFGRTPTSEGVSGRDFRLTDVSGTVVKEVLA